MCGFGQTSPSPFSSSSATGFGASAGGFGSSTFNTNNNSNTNNTNNTPGGLFGQPRPVQSSTSIFGSNSIQQQQASGSFGGSGVRHNVENMATNSNNTSGGLFGQPQQTQGSTGLFGNNTGSQQQRSGSLFSAQSLFGNNPQQQSNGLFGQSQVRAGGLFDHAPANTNNLFGSGVRQQSGGLFDTPRNDNNNSSNGSLFASSRQFYTGGGPSANNGVQSGSSPFAVRLPQAPSSGTWMAGSLEQFKERGPGGGTDIYQHLSFLKPYQDHSAEELRLIDYHLGQRQPFAEPPLGFPFVNTSQNSGLAVTNLPGSPHLTTPTGIHTVCEATVASKDAEIRLLKAKLIILEDRLQHDNDKLQSGKSGLEKSPFSCKSPIADGPRKGDPSVPVNPDPLTNNTGLDLSGNGFKANSQPISMPHDSNMPISYKDSIASQQTYVKLCAAIPSSSVHPVQNPWSHLSIMDQLELHFQRMMEIESRFSKTTALPNLKQHSLFTSIVPEIHGTNDKGKSRADGEEQIDSGASTPAVLVYTPDSSASTILYDEPKLGELTNLATEPNSDKNKKNEASNLVDKEASDKSSKREFPPDAFGVLAVLNSSDRPVHIDEIVERTDLISSKAFDIITHLASAGLIREGDDKDCYSSLVGECLRDK